MKIDMISFGKKVRNLRELKGMSQQDLAYAIGWSQGWVDYVESGKKKKALSLEEIDVIAHALSTTYETLVGTNENILDRYTEEEQQWLTSEASVKHIKQLFLLVKQNGGIR